MQATHSKEATEIMLLVSYAHKAISPILSAFALVASTSFNCNAKAFVAAMNRRLDLR